MFPPKSASPHRRSPCHCYGHGLGRLRHSVLPPVPEPMPAPADTGAALPPQQRLDAAVSSAAAGAPPHSVQPRVSPPGGATETFSDPRVTVSRTMSPCAGERGSEAGKWTESGSRL